MRVKAFAKINLGLLVLQKRQDHYHNIDTFFARVGLHDILELERRDDEKIIIATEDAEISAEKNLVWHAAWLLQKFLPRRVGANIFLHKNIPLASGLGGGSSDAAATLRALNRLWNLNFKTERLERLAMSLGADIPFFLKTGAQHGRGRGEILEQIDLPESFPREVVIVVSPIRIPTKWAYKSLQIVPNKTELKPGDLRNDFEQLVFANFPSLRRIKIALKRAGAVAASLSGSGSAIYGLFEETETAKKSLEKMQKYGDVFLTKLRD